MIRKDADTPPKVYQPLYHPQIAGKLAESQCLRKRLMNMLTQSEQCLMVQSPRCSLGLNARKLNAIYSINEPFRLTLLLGLFCKSMSIFVKLLSPGGIVWIVPILFGALKFISPILET